MRRSLNHQAALVYIRHVMTRLMVALITLSIVMLLVPISMQSAVAQPDANPTPQPPGATQPATQDPGSTPLTPNGFDAPTPMGDGPVTDDLFQSLLNLSLRPLASWIMQGASNMLMKMVQSFSVSLSPKVNGSAAEGDWFALQYQMMMNIAFWIMFPMALMAVIHAVAQGSLQLLVRIFVLFLPMSIIGTVFAVEVVQVLLQITDDLSAVFLNMVQKDLDSYFGKMRESMVRGAVQSPILDIIVGVIIVGASIGILVVLALRDASIYIATMLLPIGFAMFIWPAMARHLKRMTEFLVGIVFSKLIMAACISLGVAALAGGAGASTVDGDMTLRNGTDVSLSGQAIESKGLSDFGRYTMPGITILVITFMAPQMALRLAGNIGLGETSNVVSDAFSRNGPVMSYIFFDRVRGITRGLFGNPDGQDPMRSMRAMWSWREGSGGVFDTIRQERSLSTQEHKLARLGIYRNRDGSFGYSAAELTDMGVRLANRHQILACFDSKRNPNSATIVAAGMLAADMGSNFESMEFDKTGVIVRGRDGRSSLIVDFDRHYIGSRAGRWEAINTQREVRRTIMNEAMNQQANYGSVQGLNVIFPTRTMPGDDTARTRSAYEFRTAREIDAAVANVAEQLDGDGVRGAGNISVEHYAAAAVTGLVNGKIAQGRIIEQMRASQGSSRPRRSPRVASTAYAMHKTPVSPSSPTTDSQPRPQQQSQRPGREQQQQQQPNVNIAQQRVQEQRQRRLQQEQERQLKRSREAKRRMFSKYRSPYRQRRKML